MRGYYGIAIYYPKRATNVGSLLRTSFIFDAAFLATIGKRYVKQASDTVQATRHIPLFEYEDFDAFYENLPRDCKLVGVELDDGASMIEIYEHPQRAVYLLGAEDHGIPVQILNKCHDLIKIPGAYSLNLAVAGSIVIYDRFVKQRI